MPHINKDLVNKSKPLFISFEGGEGCGKTTQLDLLKGILQEEGINAVFTREPGGTEDGEAIRSMLLKGDKGKWDTVEEMLMFSAARSKHIRELIVPSLSKGNWVVTDRFADSTTVYQGYAKSFNMKTVNYLHNLAIDDNWPDLTILLDIPVEVGLGRKQIQATEGLDELRMESLGYSFHKMIRSGFLELAKKNPNRIKVVDARGTIAEVQKEVIDIINATLMEKSEKAAS